MPVPSRVRISFLYFWKGKVTHRGWISEGYFTCYICIYLLWKFNARESATRWPCWLLRNRFFLLSFPFDLKKFKSLDFFDFLFPFPSLPGGKIIQEEQTRALIYLQIEQDRGVSKRAGSEKHLNPSVKIIKPIRMDQLESKASIEPIKVGRQ